MIIIIYICPIFTNPVDCLKTLSNGLKRKKGKLIVQLFMSDYCTFLQLYNSQEVYTINVYSKIQVSQILELNE